MKIVTLFKYERCHGLKESIVVKEKHNQAASDKTLKHGGKRIGAGRKTGSGRFGETTKVVRIPESKVPIVKAWLAQQQNPPQAFSNSANQDQFAENFAEQFSNQLTLLRPEDNPQVIPLPLYAHKVVAGFPSPAEDYVEARLDLNDKLIRNKEATFLLSVQGDSMKDAGIMDGDILVVDRSIEPQDGKIVIAALDGELTVKRLSMKSTGTWLVPENDNYPPIAVKEEADIIIWGVVTATISQF